MLPVIAYTAMASNLFPTGAALTKIGKLEKGVPIVVLLTATSFVAEVAEYYCLTHNINNHWILHCLTLYEYTLIALLYAGWQVRRRLRRIYYLSIPVFAAIWLATKFSLETFDSSHEYMHELSAVIVVIFTLVEIVTMVTTDTVVSFYNFRFMVSVGFLIFMAGDIILFMELYKLSFMPYRDALSIWEINWWLNTTANLLIALGIAWTPRR